MSTLEQYISNSNQFVPHKFMDTQAVLSQISAAIAPLLHRIILLEADNLSIKAQLATRAIKPIKPIYNASQHTKALLPPATSPRMQRMLKGKRVSTISELLPAGSDKNKQRTVTEKSLEREKVELGRIVYNTKLVKSVKCEEMLSLRTQDVKTEKMDPIKTVLSLLQQMGNSWQVSLQAMIPQIEEAKLIDPMGVIIEMSLKNSTLGYAVIGVWRENVSQFADNEFLPAKTEVSPDSFLIAMETLLEEEELFRTTITAMPAQILINQLQNQMQPRLSSLIRRMESIKKLITSDRKITIDLALQKQRTDPVRTNMEATNMEGKNMEGKNISSTIEGKVGSPKAGMISSSKKMMNYGFKSPVSKTVKSAVPISVGPKTVSKAETKKIPQLKDPILLKKVDENVNHLNNIAEHQEEQKGLSLDTDLTMSISISTKDADFQIMKQIQQIKMREMEMDEQLLSSFT